MEQIGARRQRYPREPALAAFALPRTAVESQHLRAETFAQHVAPPVLAHHASARHANHIRIPRHHCLEFSTASRPT
eukprot:3349496-Pyramimonas_sp.AAC.1